MDNLWIIYGSGWTGWWLLFYPSEKYDFVSWDDEVPSIWKKNVPKHHQPAFGVCVPEWSIKGQLFVRLTCQIDFVQMAEQQGIKLINIINLPFNASFI